MTTSRRHFLTGTSAAAAFGLASVRLNVVSAATAGSRPRIKGAIRRDETVLRLGGSGDNFHMTWADDGRMLVSSDDGYGWNNDQVYYNTRVFAILGGPGDARFEDVKGYPKLDPPFKDEIPRYYGYGVLALDGEIYHFLSALSDLRVKSALPRQRMVGVKAIYSRDNGVTWCNQDGTSPVRWEEFPDRNRRNLLFYEEPQEAFSWLSVLQMGRGYKQNKDGYVYIYSPNGNLEGQINELVMLRVRKDKILERSRYEYFVKTLPNGEAAWSSDIGARGLVHTFPRGWASSKEWAYSWCPSVVYNAPLGLYMMSTWGSGTNPNGGLLGGLYDRPSYLGIWIAPQPWGPWTQIHEESAWLPEGDTTARAYQPQISPKWISSDGKSFWLVWSDFFNAPGDWEAESKAIDRIKDPIKRKSAEYELGIRAMPRYRFNVQRVDLLF
jgi:hypothetical protein